MIGSVHRLEQFIHQEAGGQVRALPHKVTAGDLLGRGVCPDGVPGGIIIQKALLGGGVQADAQGLVEGAVVAHPGFVIPVEQQHHRLIQALQEVQKLHHIAAGVLD